MRATTILIAVSLALMAVPADADLGRSDEDTYRCTVTVGGGATPGSAPDVGLDTGQSPHPLPAEAALGGCQAHPGLPDGGVVTAVDAHDGCRAHAEDAAVPIGGSALSVGDTVEGGQALWFHCEAGVVDAPNRITIDFGEA